MEGQWPHIASEYTPAGEPLCEWCADISVYSLIAMLAHELDDIEFENKMINALVQISSGQYAGASGWGDEYQISSYPNSLALIALANQRQ